MFCEGLLIGPYTLIRKLGRGGFGEVWLAERRAKFVTTKVAVKLPHDDQIDHETIKQEATLWEQASGHPNILPIIDADEYDGQIVIVSEFAPDGSLDEWLKAHGKMPVERAIATTIQILDGLEFLHSRNIIHRDLKPANILLQGSTPRLADFGISRALLTTVASQSQNISGTFAYMSPEALDGKRSVQTDVWSVGVNLYQLLTGELPFPQKEPSNLIAAIIMREPELLPADIPPNLKNVITKALAKQPEHRYTSTIEMLEDLKKVSDNISFPQSAPTEVLLKPILSEGFAPSVIFENEPATSETDEETLPDAKSANYLIPKKPFSIVMQINEKDSVVTQIPAAKAETASQVLPTEARALADQGYDKKNNNLLFALIGAGVLVGLVLIGIVGYNLSNSGRTTENTNKSGTSTKKGDIQKNSIGMEVVYIPAGEFMMGSSDAEIDEALFEKKKYIKMAQRGGYAYETPRHKVSIKDGFWMGKFEVTQGQWQAVMGDNPSKFSECGANCPVENVSWDDIQVFLKRLNSRDSQFEYRLPSEAEWEYAARAGTTTAFAFGDSLNSSQANFDGNFPYASTKGKFIGKTVAVGSYQPNNFGLYDMQGNVREWCQDIYNSSYKNLPTDGSANMSIGDTNLRVIRGGSWGTYGDDLRSASRGGGGDADGDNDHWGFRLVARMR